MTAKEQGLPELPEPAFEISDWAGGERVKEPTKPYFSAAQMRAYALTALASDTGERGVALANTLDNIAQDVDHAGIAARISDVAAALRAQPAVGGEVVAWRRVNSDGSVTKWVTIEKLGPPAESCYAPGGRFEYAYALTQPQPVEGGEDAEPPSNEVWPPDGSVWLAPVATDAPANPKLMQYAWGRSSLSSGQMAEAYQCIVSAAQECGQVYRLPVATPPESGGQGEAVAWRFWADTDPDLNPYWTAWSADAGFRNLCERMGYRAEFAYTHPPAQASGAVTEGDLGRALNTAEAYHELLYAVGNKYPGESRHETALRYIRQAETRDSGPGCDLTQGGGNGR